MYTDFYSIDRDAIIAKILAERRKELVFRGLRWPDLKRLNIDERYKIQLKRIVDGKEYLLEPNSLKYVLLIPQDAIDEGKLEQNKR
ncbi:SusD family protein [compost metagenome]